MKSEEIRYILKNAVQSYLALRDASFGTGAGSYVESRISYAATEIAGRTEDSQREDIAVAQEAFKRLIDEMTRARAQIQGYSLDNTIGEKTLAIALRNLCPLWPICE